MKQEIFNPTHSTVDPIMLDRALNRLYDHDDQLDGYRVQLELSYRPTMTFNNTREFKQKQYLLASFVTSCMEMIEHGVGVTPNYAQLNELLDNLHDDAIYCLFNDDLSRSISHLDHVITFEKRYQPAPKGKNGIQRVDYVITSDQRIRLGGKTNHELGRHTLIINLGCNYRNHYHNPNTPKESWPNIRYLLDLLETTK